ncbi:MAG: polysaccharide deacetylase family protein [Gloeomargarita sp. SKYBB_i_bin120]|nr:polysaccharide deacetylase family protein [Gloeomargarita sp. SKYG98]MCS7293437.1 polysaccharide deacetylase family protein [Gloeomargarita sp. SKYB120]MDW8179003.1 polysaccharide deacetylase family protein [Gloeomargarita sp. SKYBB_i_bin120]
MRDDDRPIQRLQRVIARLIGTGVQQVTYQSKPSALQVEVTVTAPTLTERQRRQWQRQLTGQVGSREIHLRVCLETGQKQPSLRRRWATVMGLGWVALMAGGWWWHSAQTSPIAKAKSLRAPLVTRPTPPVSWAWSVQRVIDREFLPQWFRRRGVRLPRETAVYAARIAPGVAGPAYAFYEAGLGAFSQDFWPASTVKVLPAIAALEWVHRQGFSGDVTVAFPQLQDRLMVILDRSIRESSNLDYDLTLQLVGLDWLNHHFLTPERGFPTTTLQRGYSGLNVYTSPPLTLQEGHRRKTLPRRSAQGWNRCPRRGNCANLFELTEAIRRVVLHRELSSAEQFRIADADIARLTASLCQAEPSFFAAGAQAALRQTPRICHKPGWVLHRHCVDSGVIIAGQERYLLAIAMPAWSAGDDCQGLSRLAQQVLTALRQAPPTLLHQPNQGEPVQAQLLTRPGGHELVVRVAGADRVAVWLDREPWGERPGPQPEYRWFKRRVTPGERLLRVQAWREGKPIAYHSQKVVVRPVEEPPLSCETPLSPIAAQVIYRGSRRKSQVALSFDDGPHGRYTPRILDILRQEGALATFFVQGRMARQHPGVLRRIQAEGHEIGNHTTHHVRLTLLDAAQFRQEVATTQALVCRLAGVQPRYLRPPFGHYDFKTASWAAELGLTLLMWDVDTRDWQHRNPQRIIQIVQQQAQPGSIILMHDIFGSTVEALAAVIATLRAKNLELVTVGQLLAPGEPITRR